MKIQKPKRDVNGTYHGLIFKNSKKELVSLHIKNACLEDIKEHASDFYLFIKHKNVAKEIYDINNDVITCVKENCASWFKTNLSDDLIEEYFTSNIIYDKNRGQVIKFKCINDLSELQSCANGKTCAHITINLIAIRFYKQKFVVEWEVEEIDIVEDTEAKFVECDDTDDDEDVPVPYEEDIEALKQQYLNAATHELTKIRDSIKKLKEREISLQDLSTKLSTAENFSQVSAACDNLDNFLQ